jgi:hypothetical protein
MGEIIYALKQELHELREEFLELFNYAKAIFRLQKPQSGGGEHHGKSENDYD